MLKVGHNKTLICFAGAGGTGKTSVVEMLEKRYNNSSADGATNAEIHRSIVRPYYASRGVSSETDFLSRDPEFRASFQMGLLAYYMSELQRCIRESAARTILCERSAFDHFAYTLYGSRELLTQADMVTLRGLLRSFCDLHPLVFYLPYPTPWDDQGADGFRAREVAKDTIIDSVIHRQISTHRSVWAGTLPFESVEARVETLLRAVYSPSPVGTDQQVKVNFGRVEKRDGA